VDLVSIFWSQSSIPSSTTFSLSAPFAESAILSADFILPLSDAFPFSEALPFSDDFSSVLAGVFGSVAVTKPFSLSISASLTPAFDSPETDL